MKLPILTCSKHEHATLDRQLLIEHMPLEDINVAWLFSWRVNL